MKVIISGGGTGGHLYPALAIGREFAKKGAEILYIGSEYGIEKNIMPGGEFPYRLLPVTSVRGKKPHELIRALHLVNAGTRIARDIINDYKPDLIVGTGGYASFPVMKAGEALGIPVMLHEANAEFGKANLNLAQKADCVCLTYEETGEPLRNKDSVLVTGMPVRASVMDVSRETGASYTGISDETLLVTVTGGSQGAHHINVAMAEYYKANAEELSKKNILFYHIIGRRNAADRELMDYSFVRVIDYENQMDCVLARTDICIGRAGASFLAEIAVRGIASVLVPYPYSGGHQEKNAAYYDKCGAAKMVLDGSMASELGPALDRLIEDAAYREQLAQRMKQEAKPHALDEIVAAGLSLIKGKE